MKTNVKLLKKIVVDIKLCRVCKYDLAVIKGRCTTCYYDCP